MIFYHFTYPKFLDAILREGLLPADSRQWMLNGQKAVWLTQVPTLKPARQAREALLRRGIWFKANSSNLPNATVCLEVRISANDERLKKVVPWMRKHPPFVDDEDALLVADDWLYFGVLRPKRLRVLKHVPPGEPYVKLPPDKGGSLDEAGLAHYLDDEEPA